jgi:hypothetical protein
MTWLPDLPTVARASFKALGGSGEPFAVQFNPASLEYTVSNEFDPRNGNNGARQIVKKTSAKLTMTLVFDTTTSGANVRDLTARIAGLLEPERSGRQKAAPKVEFAWGAYRFQGVVEQYKETIDFFSAEGVPLRASINLTLASQEVTFARSSAGAPSVDRQRPEPVQLPPGPTPSEAAARAGEPRAAREIAGQSGAMSLRAGASLNVGGGIGAGVGVSASAGVSAGARFDVKATAGAAFAGLRAPGLSASISSADARAALLPAAAGGGAAFSAGGRAELSGGGSLSAKVGADARIQFGDT